MTKTQVDYWNYQESKRHNLATEGLETGKLAETTRHNLVTEGETSRHNLVTEGETQRHNLVTEGQESQRIAISAGVLAESQRHNRAQESVARTEAQTHRMAAESQIKVNESNIALNQVKTKLAKFDLDNADVRLLTTMGDAGKNSALAYKLGSQAVPSIRGAIQWIKNGEPPAGYVNGTDNKRRGILVAKQFLDDLIKNFGNYQVVM